MERTEQRGIYSQFESAGGRQYGFFPMRIQLPDLYTVPQYIGKWPYGAGRVLDNSMSYL